MLQEEHSAILLTFIKVPFVVKIFVLCLFLSGCLRQVLLYCKCSKILNMSPVLFSNKTLVKLSFKAGIHKTLVRITNREVPDKADSSEAV